MKNLKLILLLQALVLGVLTVNADDDCPCEGGTADYSVDCDGDGTNDACSTDDCDPCEAGNPASTGMECCDGEEYDATASASEPFSAPGAITSAMEAAINAIPYVEGATATANITAEVFDCCDGEPSIVSGGKKQLTGTVGASVTFNKTLSPVDFSFSENFWGCGEIGGALVAGPFIEFTPSLSASVSGALDECTSDNWGASGTATGTVTGGLTANFAATVCDNSTSLQGNASASTGVSDTVSWNSNTGATGTACIHDLTGDISVTADIPFFSPITITIYDDYIMIQGNC